MIGGFTSKLAGKYPKKGVVQNRVTLSNDIDVMNQNNEFKSIDICFMFKNDCRKKCYPKNSKNEPRPKIQIKKLVTRLCLVTGN